MFNKIRKFITSCIYDSSKLNSEILDSQFKYIQMLQESNSNMMKICMDVINIVIKDTENILSTTSKIKEFLKETELKNE